MSAGEPLLGLRDYLTAMLSLDELRRVPGAHWDRELGAIAELSYRAPVPRALLFTDIVGYPAGRVLTGSTGSARRLGYTLRLGTDLDDAGLVAAVRDASPGWRARAGRFPPVPVSDAPLLANEVPGDAVDLFTLPVPRWREGDGGRVIGTGCFVVTSDPDTGRVNGGCYRMEVQPDGRTVTLSVVPGHDGARNIDAWTARCGRAPVTVSFGHDPLLLVAGGTDLPAGVSELAFAGAVAGAGVPVVTGPDTGLPIPAGSEVAIEGWLRPDRPGAEGPFGEWTGYYSRGRRPCPVVQITRLWYRDEPILLGTPPGRPPHDYSYLQSVLRSAAIRSELAAAGAPGVRGVWAHEAGGARLFLVVAIRAGYPGHARQVGHLAAQCPTAARLHRYVVVVDDDVDPTNLSDVVWAMSTRADPATDVEPVPGYRGSAVDPLWSGDGPPYPGRLVVDACRPYHRGATFPPVAAANPGYLAATARRWSAYLR